MRNREAAGRHEGPAAGETVGIEAHTLGPQIDFSRKLSFLIRSILAISQHLAGAIQDLVADSSSTRRELLIHILKSTFR